MSDSFRFGLEAEFMLASAKDYRPLWYKDLTFAALDRIFRGIPLDGLPSLEGLAAERPHQTITPFVVEGYDIWDESSQIIDSHPKGIEIRTPVCESLEQVLSVYEDLYSRLKVALAREDLIPVAISHHPLEDKFSGPQGKRRHDVWLWAMEVMTTYGPDINVSFPRRITEELFSDVEDLHAKVNYYAPAMVAISLSSPFSGGKPWIVKGVHGKSYRTFKRSTVAPLIEIHPSARHRIELKAFDMSDRTRDFQLYFLLVLALFLDEGLRGRATPQERIYDCGNVARFGLGAEGMKERFLELYRRAPRVLRDHGFNPTPLEDLCSRIETSRTSSDDMLALYAQGRTVNEIMREYSTLETLEGRRI